MQSKVSLRSLPYLLILGLLAACAGQGAPTPNPATPAPQPTAEVVVPSATEIVQPAASPTPRPARGVLVVEAEPAVAPAAAAPLLQLLAAAGIQAESGAGEADLRLSAAALAEGTLVWEHLLTPVDRASSVLEGITLQELREVWTGAATSPNFTAIYPSEEIMPELIALLGPAGPAVSPQAPSALADAVWADPMGLGIVPFEALTTRLRAIRLDGMSTVDNRLDPASWPLASRAWVAPTTDRGKNALAKLDPASLPITNRDRAKLTVLVMTGVTAMARNSAVAIERSGDYGFLARQVGPELAAADITLISNEIPFVKGCVADNTLNNLILCSKPEYYLNLELSGVDAVGLTGNHQNDFGYANALASLAFYKGKAIPVYGGGADDKAARAPLVIEHNGNRLGFLGANSWGPEWYWSGTGEKVSAWAGAANPGSARFDRAQMIADIQALKPQVDLVFAEVQHTEFNSAGDYQTKPVPDEEADFQALSDGGADVVTGVMAHAPQAIELRNGRLIVYGLGNLYFDQTWSWPTRTGLVVRHTLYNKKLINTELLVTVIETNFQLRWATPEERILVLKSVFDVSRW